ncbi:hypothetical protein DH2020_026688 [Rehmannia glutinosa]|uniref:Mitochondrial glycoprotein n=1 Tax=Rehmannia glutinosa TaxID=99300 RepID=A0ABR0VZ60_REHGL
MALRLVRGLRGAVKNVVLQQQSKPVNHFLKSSTRNYVSEMRKSAFESNILRLIRNEIQYELDHSPPSEGKDSNILEFVCSAWPDSIEIRQVFTRGHDRIKDQPYMGPKFKELDDELQDSLYDFLEARGVDDKLAEFLHLYMRNKDKNEYLRWMENVKSFIQKK